MKTELLTSIPPAGAWKERQYNASAGPNVWVLMTPETDEQWVGIFGPGEGGRGSLFSTALPLVGDREEATLVIAAGQGYIVNAVGTLLRRTPWTLAHAAISAPLHDRVIVASTTEIWAADIAEDEYAFRPSRPWHAGNAVASKHRVAVDGIIFDQVEAGAVTGKLWEMDAWYSFRLALTSLEVTLGDALAAEPDAFTATRERGGYPVAEHERAWFRSFQN
jgi:hypothetical protein